MFLFVEGKYSATPVFYKIDLAILVYDHILH